jgi:FkbM family methyltransferase
MTRNHNQASGSFLIKILERIVRKNVYFYYWSRRLLPLYVYFTRTAHEKYFSILKKIPKRSGIILDVGANDGLSVISMRLFNNKNPIVSLEVNPMLENRLRTLSRFIKNFRYILVGAGEKEEDIEIFTPVYKGFPLTSFTRLTPNSYDLTEYGMFTKSYDKKEHTFIKHTSKIVPIDTLNLEPMFVKIDTAGKYELSILKGMLGTIERCKPVIMIERVDFTILEIRKLLEDFGYHLVDWETAKPVSDEMVNDEPNLIFWPNSLIPFA